MDIRFEPAKARKPKPDPDTLGFGGDFTDNMFVMDYDEGLGWHDARIVPYADISIPPSTIVLHYGQSSFEGLKAYRNGDRALLFRPERNFARLNLSNKRMAIPQIDEAFCLTALRELIKLEKDWIPEKEGTSLYIRPFIISTDAVLRANPAAKFRFFIILSPSGMYYKEGLNPVPIYVEDEYVRAVKGGTGFAKTAGNYAASYAAQAVAEEKGYAQVLWLDGVHHKYVEEVGSMNVFFKLNGEVVTPALGGSILEGVTRASAVELLKSWGVPVAERQISIDELFDAHRRGTLEEAFGTGTAAVVSPIGALCRGDERITVNGGRTGRLTSRIYDTLTGIQYGKLDDPFGWVVKV